MDLLKEIDTFSAWTLMLMFYFDGLHYLTLSKGFLVL